SALHGSGALTLGEAKLPILWPGAIDMAAQQALQTDPDSVPKVLREALAAGIAAGQLPLPGAVGVEIADGQFRSKPLVIDTAEGRASGSASLDLKTLTFDAEWSLEQKPGGGSSDKPALPAVSVTYRGPVASLGGLEPRINSET